MLALGGGYGILPFRNEIRNLKFRNWKLEELKIVFIYRGPLVEIWGDQAVVEAGGIGWNIHVPVSVLARLPGIGEEVRLTRLFRSERTQ